MAEKKLGKLGDVITKHPEARLGWVPREAIRNLPPKSKYVAGPMIMQDEKVKKLKERFRRK